MQKHKPAEVLVKTKENSVDVPDFEKKWDKYMKDVKSEIPVDKDLISELGGVQGALGKLKTVKASVDKAGEELRKALVLALSAANSASKEVSGFEAVAKKIKKATPLSAATDKDLNKLIKNATALREALSKYESQTD